MQVWGQREDPVTQWQGCQHLILRSRQIGNIVNIRPGNYKKRFFTELPLSRLTDGFIPGMALPSDGLNLWSTGGWDVYV